MSHPIPFEQRGDDSPQSINNAGESSPTNEVQTPRRRRFSVAYKRRFLAEIDAAQHGNKGLILRREGLTHAHLQAWRIQLRRGRLEGRDPEQPSKAELKQQLVELQRENARLKAEAEKQQIIFEYQRRLATLLGETRPPEIPS